jgi:hypothetical protein
MKLRAAVDEVRCLRQRDRNAMFSLMEQTYANTCRNRFEDDLSRKTWAIMVRLPGTERLVGFSTQVIVQTSVVGRKVSALYSGDTVIHRDHWGDPALAHAWGNFALQLIDRTAAPYWFLTSKGFRTYRYLPLFFRDYFPRPGVEMPAWEQAVVDAVGHFIGGRRYDSNMRVIRADGGRDSVRPEFADIGLRLRTDEHVCFFVKRNPGYAQGDELCCLAPLSRENFSRAAYRIIGIRPTVSDIDGQHVACPSL